MSGRETSESLLPPRPQKSFPLSWTAAVVIFHSEDSSFSVRTFDFNLPLPSLLTAVGLFLLRCSVHTVRIAVNPDNISDLPRSAFLQLSKNVGLKR